MYSTSPLHWRSFSRVSAVLPDPAEPTRISGGGIQ